MAVFVDAGYLFAQGSAALFGSKRSRSTLLLDEAVVLQRLIDLAREKSNAELLRVYWYDGAPGARGLTPEHVSIAHVDHVKLRLGFMNSQGQQKGVDSLIVTDLIELARNRAIDHVPRRGVADAVPWTILGVAGSFVRAPSLAG
ncbi:hypothetical protein [Salinarimonas ramus]|uniref:hypothetical protein n=1 Tax=Salinarimonas ramus TaxID=690164 RepID=UPI0016629BD8|nr:hypothetical protein [Salinarimonas ramus]